MEPHNVKVNGGDKKSSRQHCQRRQGVSKKAQLSATARLVRVKLLPELTNDVLQTNSSCSTFMKWMACNKAFLEFSLPSKQTITYNCYSALRKCHNSRVIHREQNKWITTKGKAKKLSPSASLVASTNRAGCPPSLVMGQLDLYTFPRNLSRQVEKALALDMGCRLTRNMRRQVEKKHCV